MSKIQDTKEPWNGKTYSEVEEFVKVELESKAKKAKNPTDGNFAALDSDGNPVDSGCNPNTFLTDHQPLKTLNGQPLTGEGNIEIPKGADGKDAVNPFKGWFDDAETLQEAHPEPALGDYAYVKGADVSDPVDIYVAADGNWEDSGRDVDSSNTQTFQTSQSLNSVKIINDLDTGGKDDVLSAEQGVMLKQSVDNLTDKLILKRTTNLTDDVPLNNNDTDKKCIGYGYVKTGSGNYSAVIRSHSSADPDGPSTGWYRRMDNNRRWRAYKVVPESVIQLVFEEGFVPSSDNMGSLYILSEIKSNVTDDHSVHYGGGTTGSFNIVDFAEQGYKFRLPALAEGETEMYLYIVTQNGDGDLPSYGSAFSYVMSTEEGYSDVGEIYEQLASANERLESLENNADEKESILSDLKDKFIRHKEINLTNDVQQDNSDPNKKCIGYGYVKTGSGNYSAVIRAHASSDVEGPAVGWYRRMDNNRRWRAYKVVPESVIQLVFEEGFVPSSDNMGSLYILSEIKSNVTDDHSVHYGGGTTGSFNIVDFAEQGYKFRLPALAEGETEMYLYIVTQNGDGDLPSYGSAFSYIMSTEEDVDIDEIYEELSNMPGKTDTDSYFDSGDQNLIPSAALLNGLMPLTHDIKTVTTLGGSAIRYEVTKTVQEKIVREMARALAYIKWTPKYRQELGYKIPVNITGSETTHDFYDENGNVQSWFGIPYSSVKENDKYVGLDVSVYTFMTAINNPYSLLYTENVNALSSRSSWGKQYNGKNCRAYYGITCSELTSFAAGLPTGYSVELHEWLFKRGARMVEVYPQDYNYLRVGDVLVCYNGGKEAHCRLVAALERDTDNNVTAVTVVEASDEYVRVQRGTGSDLGYVKVGRKKYLDLAIGGYRGSSPYYTLAYRPVTLYKNVDCDKWSFQRPTYLDFFDPFAICEGLDFDYFITTMSKIKHEDGIWKDLYSAEAKQLLEASNKTYEYNNAICTFAGDKACYNDTDLVVVNYDLDGNYSQFDNIKVFKDGIEVASFVEETVTKSSEYIPDEKQQGHAININKELEERSVDFGPGKYYAILRKDGVNYRTDWEVVETSSVQVSRSGNGSMIDITFSSSNAIPFAIALCEINGHKLMIRELTDEEVVNGRVHTDLMRLAKEQTGTALSEAVQDNNVYFKMFFRGDYGVAVGKQECSSLF